MQSVSTKTSSPSIEEIVGGSVPADHWNGASTLGVPSVTRMRVADPLGPGVSAYAVPGLWTTTPSAALIAITSSVVSNALAVLRPMLTPWLWKVAGRL